MCIRVYYTNTGSLWTISEICLGVARAWEVTVIVFTVIWIDEADNNLTLGMEIKRRNTFLT